MSLPSAKDTSNFLQDFFNDPNKIHLSHIQQDSHYVYDFIHESIQWLKQKEEPQFTVLPYVLDKEKPTVWCGLAFNSEQANEMRTLLKAFVGNTYSDLSNQGEVKRDTKVGQSIQNYTGGFAVKFRGDFKKVMGALELMNTLRTKFPSKETKRTLSSGGLIRSFYYSLEVKDEIEAKRLLQLMKLRKFLDATNILFLEVQIYASFQKWRTLYDHDHFNSLLQIRRPKVVTHSLVQAIYRCRLQNDYEDTLDVVGAIKAFKEEVYPQNADLFSVWTNTDKPEVLKAWMIKYLGNLDTDEFLYYRLISKASEINLNDDFWQKLVGHKKANGTKEVKISEQDARNIMLLSFEDGNFMSAKEHAKQANDSSEKAAILFHCALRLEDTESFNLHLETKQRLSAEDLIKLETQIDRALKLTSNEQNWGAEKNPLPQNWIELINRINREEEFASKRALKIAEKFAADWTLSEFWKIDNPVDSLVEALSSARSSKGETILKRSLPHLLSFLWKDEKHQLELAPVYNTIFDMLAITDELNRGELLTMNELISSILIDGVSKERYQEITNGIIGLLIYYHSPHTLNCLIDLIDIILQFPIYEKNGIINLLVQTKTVLDQVGTISSISEQRQLFNSFCEYLEIPELKYDKDATTDQGQQSVWTYYKNKKVGIYTLVEGAAKRAETFLQDLNLNLEIRLNHDHVGTNALKEMAREVEVLVIVTGSAKHAATNYIKQHRGDKAVLYPVGKGSSSILSSLKEYASNS